MRRLAGIAVLVTLAGCPSSASVPPSDAGASTEVQILSLSSLLGQLDPYASFDAAGVEHDFGGLAVLSSYFAADRAAHDNTVLLVAGNSFAASPPLSAQFADVPTLKGLELLGDSAESLSDHNFDDGIPYLQNLVNQATYPYVSSNIVGVQAQVSSRVQVPFLMVSAGSVKLGVLGLTDPNAPNITFPGSFGSLTIDEPIAATNAAATQARAAGADAVIALSDYRSTGVGIAGAHTGPLIDFAQGLSGVDVVLGENDVNPTASQVGSTLVVENAWRGLSYGKTLLEIAGGRVASASATVVSPAVGGVTPDPNADALLAPYRAELAQAFDGRIGVTSAALPFDATLQVAEDAMGDVVAQAFLWKYAPVGAQVAIVNGGGIRDGLPSAYLPADATLRRPQSGYAAGPPYDLVVGDAYSVYPFPDLCVLHPITGAILWAVLEESVFDEPTPSNGFLQICGFDFTYQLSASPGARVQSVTLAGGRSIARDDTSSILLVVSDYIDGGGDNYGMLVQPTPIRGRDLAQQVLLGYLQTGPSLSATPAGRITQVP